MSLLIPLSGEEKHGRHLYKKNKFYRTLCNVMEHPETKKLYEYVSDDADAKVLFMFLFLYILVDKKSKKELSGYEKLSMMHTIFSDTKYRKSIVDMTTSTMRDLTRIEN